MVLTHSQDLFLFFLLFFPPWFSNSVLVCLCMIVYFLVICPRSHTSIHFVSKKNQWKFQAFIFNCFQVIHRISQHSLYASKLWTIKPLSVKRWYYWTLCYCFNSLYLPSICSNHLLKNSVFKIINLESNVPIIAAKLVTQWKLLFGAYRKIVAFLKFIWSNRM